MKMVLLLRKCRMGGRIFNGNNKGGLYHFGHDHESDGDPMAFHCSLEILHKRCNHPTFKILDQINKKYNLGCKNIRKNCCVDCFLNKMHKFSFHNRTYCNSPLELIHMDVWGSSPCISVNGFPYYLLIVDYFSRYSSYIHQQQ